MKGRQRIDIPTMEEGEAEGEAADLVHADADRDAAHSVLGKTD